LTSQRVLTGEHFINGDEACTEGALAAGCNFFAGYPITPATEVAAIFLRDIPLLRPQKWRRRCPDGFQNWTASMFRWKMK